MITYHDGNLLKSKCNIICHQVNLQGVMGGGLALQIAKKYPACAVEYAEHIELYANEGWDLLGSICYYEAGNNLHIANCFTQKANFDTDYKALKEALLDVEDFALFCKLSVGIPYKYGCGIANGDWEKVESIIKEVFEKSKVDCQIWKL